MEKVKGQMNDADAEKTIYEVEVPANDGKFRGGMKFYRVERAYEDELESVPSEAVV